MKVHKMQNPAKIIYRFLLYQFYPAGKARGCPGVSHMSSKPQRTQRKPGHTEKALHILYIKFYIKSMLSPQ